jgi:hypothetical protein
MKVASWDRNKCCGYSGTLDNSLNSLAIYKDTLDIGCGLMAYGNTVHWFAKWGAGLMPDTCGLSLNVRNERIDNNISVFPNSVKKTLFIDINNSEEKYPLYYTISNTMGVVLKEAILFEPNSETVVHNLAEGVYNITLKRIRF